MNLAEVALRGVNALWDIQFAAAQNLLQLQASGAAAFGAPDYSGWIRTAQDNARRLLSTGAEQMLMCARRTTQTVSDVQAQIGHMVEQRTEDLAAEWRSGFEQLGARTRESLEAAADVGRNSAAAMDEQSTHAERGTRSEHETASTQTTPSGNGHGAAQKHARRTR
jgi:hypothetical protein